MIETLARRHKRFSEPVVERLSVLAEGRPEEVLLKALESMEPSSLKRVVEESGIAAEDVVQAPRESAGPGRSDCSWKRSGDRRYGAVLGEGVGWGDVQVESCAGVVSQAPPAQDGAAERRVEEQARAWGAGIREGYRETCRRWSAG